MDLRAAVSEPLVLEPGARALVPTGLRMAVPLGYEAQVRARSGWVLGRGVVIPNATVRRRVLKKLREAGITEVNGKAIERFIMTKERF